MIINSPLLTIKVNANIFYYVVYYVYLIIFKINVFLNAFASKMFNVKIIIIYTKNFFLYNKIHKDINCEITI